MPLATNAEVYIDRSSSSGEGIQLGYTYMSMILAGLSPTARTTTAPSLSSGGEHAPLLPFLYCE